MSGTYESAQLAAQQASVTVVPRGQPAGRGRHRLRRAHRRRGRRRRRGRAAEAAAAARARAEAATSLFYVDTLEYLRRGGRVGAAAALLGGALAVKPLLAIEDGRVVNLRAGAHGGRARWPGWRSWPSTRAGDEPVDVGVAHLASAGARRPRWPSGWPSGWSANLEGREVWCGELGAVLGAHVGPGMLAVCVAPLLG